MTSTITPAREHPLLAELLSRNLPSRSRSVRHAWNHTLLSSAHDNTAVWSNNLYQATMDASNVPELVINSRVGRSITRGTRSLTRSSLDH